LLKVINNHKGKFVHKIKDIYQQLNQISPFNLQEKWDNSGLIVGNMEGTFENLYISLDLDTKLLDNIPNNSLIITHHPLIFSPLKTINFDSYSTKLLQILIKKDISLISMHTNIDKTHLNKYVCEEILNLDIVSCEDFICYANIDDSFDNFLNNISSKLNLTNCKYVKCHENIKKVAITTGSGMSLISSVDADCFLTGDIKYHDAMEASSRKISLIDIGHYESEHHFSTLLLGLLSKYLENQQLQAIIMKSKNPFRVNQQTSGENESE
jgi:dinuclear metal center YbgI/SA1388 family protein